VCEGCPLRSGSSECQRRTYLPRHRQRSRGDPSLDAAVECLRKWYLQARSQVRNSPLSGTQFHRSTFPAIRSRRTIPRRQIGRDVSGDARGVPTSVWQLLVAVSGWVSPTSNSSNWFSGNRGQTCVNVPPYDDILSSPLVRSLSYPHSSSII
jgi:hypothetical protein